MNHKAGFVNIIGNPNVGKSTLMNALVGEKLSIITSKAQTTRHRIMGIVNGEDFQIVYSDTPGLLTPNYKMHEMMMQFVDTAIVDADIFIYVVEAGETNYFEEIIKRINRSKIPVLLLINKIDTAPEDVVENTLQHWSGLFENATALKISALQCINLDTVFDKIIELLPECPPYYEKDELTDRSMRFFVSEIIREKILLNYKKEVPYCTEVTVTEYKDEPDIVRIYACIYVERDTQKGIIIGNKGAAIKKLGTESRLSIEDFVGKKVFLDLQVKVQKAWRNNELNLRRFGYEQ